MATFYIEAIEATTITLAKVGSPTVGTAMYGINDTSVPNSYNYGDSITLSAGQKCYWTITKTTTAFSTSKYLTFTSTGRINVGGNLSDLIGGETAIPRNYCFYGLFYNCDKLVDASNLVMVNDFNSKTYCYGNMFYGCTSLTSAPELPATTLTTGCYYYMFEGCTSLTTAPQLPATTLTNYCYQYMFKDCTSLTTPPQLPATTLTSSCYTAMFYGCTSLTTPPQLPATTLAMNCYASMFSGCTSLTSAPQLPATTLTDYCYYSMFYRCTNIKLSTTQTGNYQIPYRIPSSGTGTAGTNSLTNMFGSTGGTFTGTPTINTTYYMSYPVSIAYNGNYIAGIESGTKTLDCSGKYMDGNVVVTADKPVDIIYNGTRIVSNATGTKTLYCAGNTMNGDVKVITRDSKVIMDKFKLDSILTDLQVVE